MKKNTSQIKVEKVALLKKRPSSNTFQQFVMALKNLEVGESFLYKIGSNHRIAISTVQTVMDRQFVVNSSAQAGMLRVGRIV